MTVKVTVIMVAAGANSAMATGTEADGYIGDRQCSFSVDLGCGTGGDPGSVFGGRFLRRLQGVTEEEATGDLQLTLNSNCSNLCQSP